MKSATDAKLVKRIKSRPALACSSCWFAARGRFAKGDRCPCGKGRFVAVSIRGVTA